MLAVTATATLVILIAAPIIVASVLAVARAVMKVVQNRQFEARERDSLTELLLGTKTSQSGIPGREGWIFKVDRALEVLAAGQGRTETAVNKILREVKDDNNGDHNLRGIVKRGAEAAGAEVVRVRKNEDDAK